MKKNKIYGLIYILIWIFLIGIFFRDFFNVEDILKLKIKNILKLIELSFIQGVLSVLLATIVAIVPAYYMSYNEDRLSRLLESLIFIPFFFPTVSTVISVILILKLPILRNFNILYTIKAILLANVFYNSPIMLKYIGQGLRGIPNEIEEAGLLDGLSPVGVLFKIKLPLICSHIFRGMFLVFLYTFSSFGIVLALGGIRFWNLEVTIANTLMKDANFSLACILGILQFLIFLLINIFGEKLPSYELEEKRKTKKISKKIKLGAWIYLTFEYLILIIGIAYGFYDYYNNQFSLNSFFKIFTEDMNRKYPIIESIKNSILIGGVISLVVIVFAFVLLKNRDKLVRIILFSSMGFSSAFLGILLIYQNILYDIPHWFLLGIGYFLVTLPVACSFMYQYVVYFPKDIYGLSELDGVGGMKRFFLIELPMLKKMFMGTFLQIFAILIGEFTISYTMQLGRDFPTIALVNYSLYSDKRFLEGATMSSFNIMLILVLFYISNLILKEKE